MTGAAVASAAVGATSMVKGFGESRKAGEEGDKAVAAAEKNLGVASDLNALLLSKLLNLNTYRKLLPTSISKELKCLM